MRKDLILIGRLKELLPYQMKWNEKLLTLDDITLGIENGIQEQNDEYGNCSRLADPKPDEWHIGRVIFFINHPDKINPIDIDNAVFDGMIYPIPIVSDGNHRFMAAMYLHYQGLMDKIPCYYGGRLDLLDYLTGDTDIIPGFPI